MRYFLDTEFAEDGKTIELISIGIVAEDGRELYAVSSEFDPARCNDWVKANVLPQLPPCNCANVPRLEGHAALCLRKPRSVIARWVRDFVGDDPDPEFWAYYASYDWVVLCQLFGAMIDMPDGFPMHCMDLQQFAIHVGTDETLREHVPQTSGEHDALCDARWNRDAHAYLESLFCMMR